MFCFARKFFFQAVAVLLFFNTAQSQFEPVAGLPGSTAMPADSSAFTEWATGCIVQRGFINIANSSLGYASAGADTSAMGAPDGSVVSLGDGGIATVTFNNAIYNGEGFDFAIFENGFMTNDSNLAFLELGFVEVSSDGIHFFRFPSESHVQDSMQIASFIPIDGGQINNLAGKYKANYGTPFDLEELADSVGLDINNVTHLRIIDVVGSINPLYATYDSKGNIINDPWPTAFPSGGFDLDAVGVINAKAPNAISNISDTKTVIYPNPVKQGNTVFIESDNRLNNVVAYDLSGRVVKQGKEIALHSNNSISINTSSLSPGIYFINATAVNTNFNLKLIVE